MIERCSQPAVVIVFEGDETEGLEHAFRVLRIGLRISAMPCTGPDCV